VESPSTFANECIARRKSAALLSLLDTRSSPPVPPPPSLAPERRPTIGTIYLTSRNSCCGCRANPRGPLLQRASLSPCPRELSLPSSPANLIDPWNQSVRHTLSLLKEGFAILGTPVSAERTSLMSEPLQNSPFQCSTCPRSVGRGRRSRRRRTRQ
jgi:hypothetical protein